MSGSQIIFSFSCQRSIFFPSLTLPHSKIFRAAAVITSCCPAQQIYVCTIPCNKPSRTVPCNNNCSFCIFSLLFPFFSYQRNNFPPQLPHATTSLYAAPRSNHLVAALYSNCFLSCVALCSNYFVLHLALPSCSIFFVTALCSNLLFTVLCSKKKIISRAVCCSNHFSNLFTMPSAITIFTATFCSINFVFEPSRLIHVTLFLRDLFLFVLFMCTLAHYSCVNYFYSYYFCARYFYATFSFLTHHYTTFVFTQLNDFLVSHPLTLLFWRSHVMYFSWCQSSRVILMCNLSTNE